MKKEGISLSRPKLRTTAVYTKELVFDCCSVLPDISADKWTFFEMADYSTKMWSLRSGVSVSIVEVWNTACVDETLLGIASIQEVILAGKSACYTNIAFHRIYCALTGRAAPFKITIADDELRARWEEYYKKAVEEK